MTGGALMGQTERPKPGPEASQSLEQLYKGHRGKVSDKWSSYLPEYDRLFAPYRDRPVRLLEIGVQNGGSLEIWSRYFANAKKIIGCDVDQACANLRYDDSRISVIIGDANSDEVLASVAREASALDIIIDDGSHRSGDVVKSFSHYFPLLTNGGLYVIEDLHCSYWRRFGGGLYEAFSSVTFLKRLADVVNHEHWGVAASRRDLLEGFASKYDVTISERVLQAVHSIELTNSLGVVRKERPTRNRLRDRIVAGSIAEVAPEALQLESHAPLRSDETDNEWARRAMPPEQELPLRLGELADLERRLDEHGSELAKLASHLDAREEEIARLEDSLAEQEGRLAEGDAELARLASHPEARAAEVARLKASLTDWQDTVAARDSELVQLKTSIAEQQRVLTERDSELDRISRSFDEHEKELARLTEVLAERDRELAGQAEAQTLLEGRLAAAAGQHRAEMERLTGALAERDRDLASLRSTLTLRNGELEELRASPIDRGLDVARLERDLADLHSSRSWQLTAPLRAVAMHVRRWLIEAKTGALIVRTGLTSGPRAGLRLLRDRRLLLRSGAFDSRYYLSTYRDVAAAAIDPALHYLIHGARERRDPDPLFDTAWYVEQYRDVATTGHNPLVHYLRFGAREGRDPSPKFRSSAYLSANPDVARAGVNPLAHYLTCGRAEGRSVRPSDLPEGVVAEPISASTAAPSAHSRRSAQAAVVERIKHAVIPAGPTTRSAYSEWITLNDTLSNEDRLLIRTHISTLAHKPKVSILMRVHDADTRHLADTLRSIEGQLYDNWELCVVDDASLSTSGRQIVQDHARNSRRIKSIVRRELGGQVRCANDALSVATGDWVVLIDPEDLLSEHALYVLAQALNTNSDVDLVYSDHDRIGSKGSRKDPYFKPQFDYDLLLGHNFISHLAAYRSSLVRELGGFRAAAGRFYDWDLSLRFLEHGSSRRVLHVPFILYHRRDPSNSESLDHSESNRHLALQVVNSHLSRTRQSAEALEVDGGSYLRIQRHLNSDKPLVSVIIPTRDQYYLLRMCIEGLLLRTDYRPIEVIIVDNGSVESDAVRYLASLDSREDVKIIRDPRPFNFARLSNLGVASSSGDICLFLNNDVNVINSGWLDEMVSHAMRPEVGAVGAKLYYENDTLQHGGVVLGIYNARGSVAGHIHRGVPRGSPGYFGRLNLTVGVSAVTAACMAMRRDVFDEVGGFNEVDLAVSFNDVDLCLRARTAGYVIIWTPHAELFHYESVSRGGPRETPEKAARNDAERACLRRNWAATLDDDPFYSPNLSLESASFDLAKVSRVHKPWWSFEFPSSSPIEQPVAAALLRIGGQRTALSVTQRLAQLGGFDHRIASYSAERKRLSTLPNGRNKVAVYTAILDGYDSMKLPEAPDPRFDYVLFTDTSVPDTGIWHVRPVTYRDEDSTRSGRYVKTHPHWLLPGYDVAVWVDSNITIVGDVHPYVEAFAASATPVAAIAHPMRCSVFEELEACKHFQRDDARTMMEQIASYRETGFGHKDLIESNFMMFDLRHPDLLGFLTRWWSEIDRHSRRDQLSINYSFGRSQTSWYPITPFPNSIRNNRHFAFADHDSGNGPTQDLVTALHAPDRDPYSGPSYGLVRGERVAAQRDRRIDIVVCVHNAQPDVQRCLESITRHRTSANQRLVIIDDGCNTGTADYLRSFAEGRPWVLLERNETARGYTKAANQGLRFATGELMILLNSDTVVTDSWTEKLADALFSTPGAGIVGPMSNAASYQSIPEYRSRGEQTAINEIPAGFTIDDMNRYCEQWTVVDVLPRVPLVHGFCFALSRGVLNAVGMLDETRFPKGYGEENDYCFRAVDAGFGLVIATHTYVFHAKSRSYAGRDRVRLTKEGAEALNIRYGARRVARAVHTMESHRLLVDIRERAKALTSAMPARS